LEHWFYRIYGAKSASNRINLQNPSSSPPGGRRPSSNRKFIRNSGNTTDPFAVPLRKRYAF
jgi:hypothetical protein